MWLPLVALYGIRAAAARPDTNEGLSREPGIAAQETGLVSQILSLGRTCFLPALILTHSLTALMTVIVMAIVLAIFVLLRHREGLVSRFFGWIHSGWDCSCRHTSVFLVYLACPVGVENGSE